MAHKPFSEKEIHCRHDKLREKLDDKEAFVAFSFTGSYYLSGAPIVHWGRPTITVIPKSAPAFMITSAMETPRVMSLGHISEIKKYTDAEGPSLATGVRLLCDALKSRGLKKIAFDGAMTPFGTIELLHSMTPDLESRDGTDDLNNLRKVHSKEEVAHIRKAVATSDVGVSTILESARIGQPESEIAAIASQEMAVFAAREFPEVEMSFRCYSQQGERTLEPHSGTSGEPLTAGNLLQVVIEAAAWSYMSAVERTIALGELPDAEDKYYTTLTEAHEASVAALQPNAPASAPHEAASAIFMRDGYGNSPFGTGLLRGMVSEWEGRIPTVDLRSYNSELLLPGMTVTIEPFTIVEGVGATRHCDMVLVTESGYERLSKAPTGRLRIG